MRRNIRLLVLIIFFYFNSYSQENTLRISGKIYYDFSYRFDTSDKNRIFSDKLVLAYSKGGALFQSQKKIDSKNAFKEWIKAGSIGTQPRTQGLQDEYYTNTSSKDITRVRILQSTFLMTEPLDAIDWKIESETKKMGNFICQKATGFCRGRKYIAWFCNDLPYNFGPWKLNGLPGIIFEASDDKNEVIFQFSHIETFSTNDVITFPVNNFIRTTESEFEKMRQTMIEQYIPSSPGISPGSVSIEVKNSQGDIVKPKRTIITNPIDLKTRLPVLF